MGKLPKCQCVHANVSKAVWEQSMLSDIFPAREFLFLKIRQNAQYFSENKPYPGVLLP